jgi:hypothetical protein
MADPAPSEGLSLRVLLLLGFGSVFALWLISAYALADSMIRTDTRSTALRTRFVKNEQLLSTVRAQALLSSVYLRDALLDARRVASAVLPRRAPADAPRSRSRDG